MTEIYLYMPWVCIGKEDAHYPASQKVFVSFPTFIDYNSSPDLDNYRDPSSGKISWDSYHRDTMKWIEEHKNPESSQNGHYITTTLEYIKEGGYESDLRYQTEKTRFHL